MDAENLIWIPVSFFGIAVTIGFYGVHKIGKEK